jgi:hypothetical protein
MPPRKIRNRVLIECSLTPLYMLALDVAGWEYNFSESSDPIAMMGYVNLALELSTEPVSRGGIWSMTEAGDAWQLA